MRGESPRTRRSRFSTFASCAAASPPVASALPPPSRTSNIRPSPANSTRKPLQNPGKPFQADRKAELPVITEAKNLATRTRTQKSNRTCYHPIFGSKLHNEALPSAEAPHWLFIREDRCCTCTAQLQQRYSEVSMSFEEVPGAVLIPGR